MNTAGERFARYRAVKQENLIAQYLRSDVEDYVDSLQSLLLAKENEWFQMLDTLTDASLRGVGLDAYGALLGLARFYEEGDGDFQRRITEKRILMKADGTLQNSLDILEGIGKAPVSDFLEVDCGVIFFLNNDMPETIRNSFLRFCRPGGVAYGLYAKQETNNTFSYQSGEGYRGYSLLPPLTTASSEESEGDVAVQGGVYSLVYGL